VDKSFYDIGTSDLKELWEADLDPVSARIGMEYRHLTFSDMVSGIPDLKLFLPSPLST